ncbi:MAG: hypothetical protein ACYS0D_09515, partial [Planctomycetota bacterium]
MRLGHCKRTLTLVLVAAALAAGGRARSEETGFASPLGGLVNPGKLNKDVPAPHTIIGHVVGETAVRYGPLVEYLEAL